MRSLFRLLLKFYQRYISPLSPPSCRYYPTCSEYAVWQVENNSIFKAIYFTISRVLKCNQLFDGGIDYPLVKLKKLQNVNFEKIKIKYWYIPTENGKYFVVKNREWKQEKE